MGDYGQVRATRGASGPVLATLGHGGPVRTALEVFVALREAGLAAEVREASATIGETVAHLCGSSRKYAPGRRALWAALLDLGRAEVTPEAIGAFWGLPGATVEIEVALHRSGHKPAPKVRRVELYPRGDETTPGLRHGRGERRECDGYAECLDRFVREPARHDGDEGRCPRRCSGYVPLRLDVRHFMRAPTERSPQDRRRYG